MYKTFHQQEEYSKQFNEHSVEQMAQCRHLNWQPLGAQEKFMIRKQKSVNDDEILLMFALAMTVFSINNKLNKIPPKNPKRKYNRMA